MEVFWSTPQSRVCYDPETGTVTSEWLDYNTSQNFREATKKSLELTKIKQSSKLLVDTEKLKIIFAEDQKFISEELFPQMKAAGTRFVAMVNSLHYFAQIGARQITSTFGSEVVVEYFQNRESAFQWLKTVQIDHK